jgi:hypothetical protein
MIIVFVWLNTVIFLSISAVHFYWAAGGRWKRDQVIPQSINDVALFKPRKLACILVAAGLLLFALISAGSLGLFKRVIGPKAWIYGNAVIGTVFLARALGDGKYLGFFKKIRHTNFAKNDTRLYTPLSLYISAIAWMITWQLYSQL